MKDKNDSVRLMGFGHRVYKNFDPRAKIIRSMCYRVLEKLGRANNPLFDLALQLEEIALKDEYFVSRKLYPNVDFYSGIIYSALGIPRSMFTVMFAIARTAGWVAHWQEMVSDPQMRIGRPRQLYTGPTQRDYRRSTSADRAGARERSCAADRCFAAARRPPAATPRPRRPDPAAGSRAWPKKSLCRAGRTGGARQRAVERLGPGSGQYALPAGTRHSRHGRAEAATEMGFWLSGRSDIRAAHGGRRPVVRRDLRRARVALDAKSGCTYWNYDLPAGASTAISIGELGVSETSGDSEEAETHAGASDVIKAPSAAFFGDDSGAVYALDAKKGHPALEDASRRAPAGANRGRADAERRPAVRCGCIK